MSLLDRSLVLKSHFRSNFMDLSFTDSDVEVKR